MFRWVFPCFPMFPQSRHPKRQAWRFPWGHPWKAEDVGALWRDGGGAGIQSLNINETWQWTLKLQSWYSLIFNLYSLKIQWKSNGNINEHFGSDNDIHWYSNFGTNIYIYINIYKYPMNMNEYLWNSGYWWWNLIHNSCIRIFDWWLIGLWSLGSLFLSNPWYSQKMGASMGPHYHQ